MAKNKHSVGNKNVKQNFVENDRNQWGKLASFALLFLVIAIPFCLVWSWLFGNQEYSKISDNFLTGMIQNYHYLVGTFCLIPVVIFLYKEINLELNKKKINENNKVMYGFFGFVIAIALIIAVCSLVYPINSSTYYGINSVATVSIFLCPVVILLFEVLIYGCLVLPRYWKEGTLGTAIKQYLPIILMVMFLIWTFISCMLAPSAADDVIGAEAAKNSGASPSEVLSKTLNGCYNLKDGFWAFLMYGSVLLAGMLMGKDKIEKKKRLVKIFVISISVLSIITMGVTAYGSRISSNYRSSYEQYASIQGGSDSTLSEEQIAQKAELEAYNSVYNKWFVYPERGIFRNMNHFAYVLCMAVMASLLLAVTEKKWYEKVLFLATFTILIYMLIINDTFGGYLGVLISLIALIIYAIGNLISYLRKKAELNPEEIQEKKSYAINLLTITLVGCILTTIATFTINNSGGYSSEVGSFQIFFNDIKNFGGFFVNEENATQANVSELSESITKAGSGRGETWLKVWELIKQRPIFGYGLECLLFQFSGQFGINEGRTHNLLLQLLATVGIPGTIMYFSALAIVFIRLLKNWKSWNDIEKICVFVGIAYMSTALTGNSSYYTSPYFMMFLGFVACVPWKKRWKDGTIDDQ